MNAVNQNSCYNKECYNGTALYSLVSDSNISLAILTCVVTFS